MLTKRVQFDVWLLEAFKQKQEGCTIVERYQQLTSSKINVWRHLSELYDKELLQTTDSPTDYTGTTIKPVFYQTTEKGLKLLQLIYEMNEIYQNKK